MTGTMSIEHKAALAKGRAEGKAVREYLEALRDRRPQRGRKRTEESIRAQIVRVAAQLEEASALDELLLIQRRRDLESELDLMQNHDDFGSIEAAFVAVAASYSAAKGIDYSTWREVGVEAAVLKSAGVARSNSSS